MKKAIYEVDEGNKKLFSKPIPPDRQVCKYCGCTQERACPGGCWWVRENICSRCRPDLEPKAEV